MNVTINFVCRGRNFELPKKSTIDMEFDHVLAPNSPYTLPSGIERRMDYGYADLSKTVSAGDVDKTLRMYLDSFKKCKSQLVNYGLEETTLYLTFEYDLQFNWEFEPSLLGELYNTDITLAISAYQQEK
jgi:hypothetical protein